MKLIRILLLLFFAGFIKVASANGTLDPIVNLAIGAAAPTSNVDISVTITEVGNAANVTTKTLVMYSGTTQAQLGIFDLFSPTDGDYIIYITCDDICPNVVQSGYYHNTLGLVGDAASATAVTVSPTSTATLNITLPFELVISGTIERPAGLATNFAIDVEVMLVGSSGTNTHDSVSVIIPVGATSASYTLVGYPNYQDYSLRYECNTTLGCIGVANYGYRIHTASGATPSSSESWNTNGVKFNTGLSNLSAQRFILLEGEYVDGTIQYASGSGFTGNFSGEIELCRINATSCYSYTLINQNISTGFYYKIYVASSYSDYSLRYTCTSCHTDMIESAFVKDGGSDDMTIHSSMADTVSITPQDLANGSKTLPDINVLKGVRIEGLLSNSSQRSTGVFFGNIKLQAQNGNYYTLTQAVPYQNPLNNFAFSFLVPDDGDSWRLSYEYVFSCGSNNCHDSRVLPRGYYESTYTVPNSADTTLLASTPTNNLNLYVVNKSEVNYVPDLTPIYMLLLFDDL